MNRPTERELANCRRQAELIHLTLGYHTARMETGHPFALGNNLASVFQERIPSPPRQLDELLRGQPRIALDPDAESDVRSPVERIRQGITASVWDSYNQIVGFVDAAVNPELHPFILDPELDALIEEMDAEAAAVAAADPMSVHTYVGSSTVHSGLSVGIGMMTTLSAIEEGIPEHHPFDALAVARIIAKTDAVRLAIAKMNFGPFLTAFPDQLPSFLDSRTSTGLSAEKLADLLNPSASGCPALSPMGDRARSILKRHGLYRPDLDGAPAIKILGTQIRSYLSRFIGDLRVSMDFLDSKRLPEFDRRVVDRTLLGTPVPPKRKP